jgi:hypothetical protein
MDRRTWQALTTGFVELPRRRIHAGCGSGCYAPCSMS